MSDVSMVAASAVRVTLSVGRTRVDVAIPPGATVADVLGRLEVDAPPGSVLLRTNGVSLAGGDLIAGHVSDGEVLVLVAPPDPHVSATQALGQTLAVYAQDQVLASQAGGGFDVTGAGSRRRAVAPEPATRRSRSGEAAPDTQQVLALTPLFGARIAISLFAGAALLAVLFGSTSATAADNPLAAWLTAAAFLISAAGITMRSTETDHIAIRILAPALAFVGGASAPQPVGEGSMQITIVAGAIAAAVCAAIMRLVAARSNAADPLTIGVFLGLAVLGMLSVYLGWRVEVVVSLAAGVAPMLLRALPSMGIDVPEVELIDVERLASTAWSVRTQGEGAPKRRRRRRALRAAPVRRAFDQARQVVVVGTTWVCLIMLAGALAITVNGEPRGIAGWCAATLPALLALAVGFMSRSVRDRAARYTMIATTFGLVVIEAYALTRILSVGMTLLFAFGMVVLAGILWVAASALAKNWTSPQASRWADRAEKVGVVFSLPVALAAVGTIDAIRMFVS